MRGRHFLLVALGTAMLQCAGARRGDSSHAPPSEAASDQDSGSPGASSAVPAGRPAASVVDASPPGDPCDELVAQARGNCVGLMKQPDPPLDPICQWRVDDAMNEACNHGLSSADAKRIAKALRGGVRQSTGTTPIGQIADAFRARRSAVASCVKDVAAARPSLRVRMEFDASGTATSIAADYRIVLPPAARVCVLRSLHPIHLSRATVVYVFDT